MGKSTISMSIFNSYVSLSEGKSQYPLVIKHGNGTSRIGFHKKTSIAIGCSVPTMITKGQPPVNFLNICKLSNYHTHHLSITFLALPMVLSTCLFLCFPTISHYIPFFPISPLSMVEIPLYPIIFLFFPFYPHFPSISHEHGQFHSSRSPRSRRLLPRSISAAKALAASAAARSSSAARAAASWVKTNESNMVF